MWGINDEHNYKSYTEESFQLGNISILYSYSGGVSVTFSEEPFPIDP